MHTYTALFSFCGIVGAFISPILGALSDWLLKQRNHKSSTQEEFRYNQVACHFSSLLITTLCTWGLIITLSTNTSVAIYVALLCLTVCRSSLFSVSTAFLRARFPAGHLDRLLGIYGTISALFVFAQYPYFHWLIYGRTQAIVFGAIITGLSISYPLHILMRKKMMSILTSSEAQNEDETTAINTKN